MLAATGPLLMTPLEEIMDAIADAGFEGAEVMISQNPATQDPDRIAQAAAQSGIAVPAVHGPYLLLTRPVLGRTFAQKTIASMEIAHAVGAEVMVAHAPFRWEVRSRRFMEEDVVELEADTGVRFGMENLFPVRGRAFSSVITIEDMLPFDHLVMDTSHCAVAGIDIFEMWRELKEQIVHLHVANNYGHGRDSHAPLERGVLDVEAFLAEVGASGWGGTITLELDCRPHLDSHDALVAFLARQRVRAEAALAGAVGEVAS